MRLSQSNINKLNKERRRDRKKEGWEEEEGREEGRKGDMGERKEGE